MPEAAGPGPSGTEWLYEDGIGEARAALIEHGEIVEALIDVEGAGPRPGAIVDGRLTAIAIPQRRGYVTLDDGDEVLVEPLPRDWTQGARVRLAITREAVAERDRTKRAKGRPAPGLDLADAPDLRARIGASGIPVRLLSVHEPDALEAAGWSELLESAETGVVPFAGGALRIMPTPAMTLIDIDGHLDPDALARTAAPAAARAIRLFGIGGSIGIDFPTLGDREARLAVAAAFDAALARPFERTAINGFGFMQIVRPRLRASLIEHVQGDADGHAARALLRRAARDGRTGATTLVGHPRVIAVLAAHPDWLDRLGRHLGGAVGLRANASIAMSGGYAEPA